MREAFAAALGAPVERAVRVAGGASKETWAVDLADGRSLIVRRALGGVIHRDTLALREEFDVLVAAFEAGIAVPEPIAYLGDVEGREAFAMERLEGETIGRRLVRQSHPGLDVRLAEELARIHAIPRYRVPFLPEFDRVDRLRDELDLIGEPHPAIEAGLAWCREHLPLDRPRVVLHGDFRVGNIVVGPEGLVGVLDWEFAHVGDPLEDLSWPLVRAWRFGVDELRLGGFSHPDAYLERYAELTGIEVSGAELDAWEILGNCSWAVGALSQSRRHLQGEDPSVEFAILGRLAAGTELELLGLLARAEGHTWSEPVPVEIVHDRPSAGELAAAVRAFVEDELLPVVDDPRLRFRTLVALNALGIVERESPAPVERDPSLARRIRSEGWRAADLDVLRADVVARLRVANPQALP